MALIDKTSSLSKGRIKTLPSSNDELRVSMIGPKNTVYQAPGSIKAASIMSYQAPQDSIPGGPVPPGPAFSNAYNNQSYN